MPSLNTPAPSFDDVWRTIQELALSQKETERLMKESQKEADRRQQEADQRIRETERLMKESQQEADRRMSKTDKQIRALAKQLGEHGNRLGQFVQEMVRPAVVDLFQDRKIPVHQVHPNIVAYDDNRQFIMEVDLLVVNTDTAVVVECKSRLTYEDVDEHLARMAKFKSCFPQFSAHILFGAVAAMVLPDDVGHYARNKGLFVLAQSGDAVEIRNEDGFDPKAW
ncbi:DUF3782 domain-containing protein [Magnetovirga frankeli]|uniref:Ku70/Ku80 C-terminal arm domain-containing protein n=1 Tax=Magnetovirga frankeli TaxID=947516 RepID=UPI001292F112|nr:DUF3782 domain-containing protein [gamma proteobacterium SS-5]